MALAAIALTLPAMPLQAQEGENTTIIEVLEASGNYTSFLQAVRASGLEETLKGEGPFTVFAPTDEAFAKLPEARLAELMADPAELRDLVSYHIVRQNIGLEGVTESTSVETMQGSTIAVERTEQGVVVRAPAAAAEVTGGAEPPAPLVATIVTPDVKATNGVIHGIDIVLITPQE
jgi:uncharacterized surface protein with fasciclin (FAS1) repeats